MTEIQARALAPSIYCWEGPKMKLTLFSATIGTLIATDSHLLFLSTGKSDVGKKMRRAAASPILGVRSQDTSHLDLSALHNPGSLEVPVGRIARAEAGKKRALVLHHRSEDGEELAHSFGGQMGMPDLQDWVDLLQQLKD